MDDLENPLKQLKSPKYLLPFISIVAFCMVIGFVRGSVGGLIFGEVIGIVISFFGAILIQKHQEREQSLRESIIIPKPGMTEKNEALADPKEAEGD